MATASVNQKRSAHGVQRRASRAESRSADAAKLERTEKGEAAKSETVSEARNAEKKRTATAPAAQTGSVGSTDVKKTKDGNEAHGFLAGANMAMVPKMDFTTVSAPLLFSNVEGLISKATESIQPYFKMNGDGDAAEHPANSENVTRSSSESNQVGDVDAASSDGVQTVDVVKKKEKPNFTDLVKSISSSKFEITNIETGRDSRLKLQRAVDALGDELNNYNTALNQTFGIGDIRERLSFEKDLNETQFGNLLDAAEMLHKQMLDTSTEFDRVAANAATDFMTNFIKLNPRELAEGFEGVRDLTDQVVDLRHRHNFLVSEHDELQALINQAISATPRGHEFYDRWLDRQESQ